MPIAYGDSFDEHGPSIVHILTISIDFWMTLDFVYLIRLAVQSICTTNAYKSIGRIDIGRQSDCETITEPGRSRYNGTTSWS